VNNFYKHFSKDKTTNFGMALSRRVVKKFLEFGKIDTVNDYILEIGPGRGQIADICQNYEAIEPNKDMADNIENKGKKVYRTLVPPLPTVNKKYDCVILKNVLEHMPTATDASRLCEEIRNVLKPNGKILISIPDFLNEKRWFYAVDFSHNYVTTRKRVESLLESAGYHNIKSKYYSCGIEGFLCFLVSWLASKMPFIYLDSIIDNWLIHKPCKLQLSFLRKIFICAESEA
jgi:SAM-dependent methyltransferase